MSDFPVDDLTLDCLEHALNTSRGLDGLVGGEYTLSQFLDFMSGYNPSNRTVMSGDVYELHDVLLSEQDVIRALLAEVRRLRRSTAQ